VAPPPPALAPPTAAVPPPPARAEASPAPSPPEADDLDDEEPGPAPSLAGPRDAEADAWARAVDALRQVHPRQGKSLSHARFLGFAPEGARIAFARDAAFHRTQVTGMSRPLVEAELARSLGRPVRLLEQTDAEAFAQAPRSIAEVEAADRATREKRIVEKVREHPAIRAVLTHLGGAIEHVQVLDAPPDQLGATADDDASVPD
jgi:hypothetical protein